MRRVAGLAAITLLALVALAGPTGAKSLGDEATAGASIDSGTPVAIVVRAPGGDLASYSKPGGGRGPRWTCAYYSFENGGSGDQIAVDYSSGPVDPVPQQSYILGCRDERGVMRSTRFVQYNPADPLAGLFAAERAAELALEQLALPDPQIHLNPPTAQLVGVATWLWVDNPWQPIDAAASITGVTSTVVAVPVEVTWDLGDGTTLTCPGPGTAFDPLTAARAQASDCAHTYIWPSNRQPFGAYAVTATISYSVDWTATTGAGGGLGALTRTATVPVVVEEAQAIIG